MYAGQATNNLLNNFPGTFWHIYAHVGDGYATSWTNQRANFYGVSGIPAAWFDGLQSVIGAGSQQSAYNNHLAKINARRAVTSDL